MSIDIWQHGESAIHLACGLGQLEAVQFLVKKGGDLNATDAQGDTPLHWAARQGHAQVIAYLIEQGSQINAQNKVSYVVFYHCNILYVKRTNIKMHKSRN